MPSTGTNFTAIKTAIKTLLNARQGIITAGVTVLNGQPTNADDLTAADGDLDAIWFGGNADAEIVVPYSGSQVRHEVMTFQVVCQAVRRGRHDDLQATADAAADVLLAEVLSLLASDPDLSTANVEPLAVIAQRWSYDQLPPAANARGARYELTCSTRPAGIAAPT